MTSKRRKQVYSQVHSVAYRATKVNIVKYLLACGSLDKALNGIFWTVGAEMYQTKALTKQNILWEGYR